MNALASLRSLSGKVLVLLAEAAIAELDGRQPDPEAGVDVHDGCEAEDVPHHGSVLPATGDEDDTEKDDHNGTLEVDKPNFPGKAFPARLVHA